MTKQSYKQFNLVLGLLIFIAFNLMGCSSSDQDNSPSLNLDLPMRGQYYPLYYNQFVNPQNIPDKVFQDINLIIIGFACVYNSSSVYVTKYGWNPYVLTYEEARGDPTKRPPDYPLVRPDPGDYDQDRIKALAQRVRLVNPKTKILICLGWGHKYDYGMWDAISEDYKTRKHLFPDSVAKFVVENGLDGFDIDWESINWSSGSVDKETFRNVIIATRTALKNANPNYILSISPDETLYLDDVSILKLFDIINEQPRLPVDTFIGKSPTTRVNAGACQESPEKSIEDAVADYKKYSADGVISWNMELDKNAGYYNTYYMSDHVR